MSIQWVLTEFLSRVQDRLLLSLGEGLYPRGQKRNTVVERREVPG